MFPELSFLTHGFRKNVIIEGIYLICPRRLVRLDIYLIKITNFINGKLEVGNKI